MPGMMQLVSSHHGILPIGHLQGLHKRSHYCMMMRICTTDLQLAAASYLTSYRATHLLPTNLQGTLRVEGFMYDPTATNKRKGTRRKGGGRFERHASFSSTFAASS